MRGVLRSLFNQQRALTSQAAIGNWELLGALVLLCPLFREAVLHCYHFLVVRSRVTVGPGSAMASRLACCLLASGLFTTGLLLFTFPLLFLLRLRLG